MDFDEGHCLCGCLQMASVVLTGTETSGGTWAGQVSLFFSFLTVTLNPAKIVQVSLLAKLQVGRKDAGSSLPACQYDPADCRAPQLSSLSAPHRLGCAPVESSANLHCVSRMFSLRAGAA